MKKYTIPKGKHRSGLHFKPHFGEVAIAHNVTFNESAVYNLPDDDQLDINKLFGISYGLHHTNSARFGWRYNPLKPNKIEISSYCYVDGKRTTRVIGNVNFNTPYYYEIYKGRDHYMFLICDDNDNVVYIGCEDHNCTTKFGYHLYPYFGGSKPAPQNINIIFNDLI